MASNCVIDVAPGSHAYAICTPPGCIYTVDEDNSTADCMLVENGTILAIGNKGMPKFLFLGIPCLTVAHSEQIRKYWSARSPNVLLEMFQTPPGSIIVPGLAGMTL